MEIDIASIDFGLDIIFIWSCPMKPERLGLLFADRQPIIPKCLFSFIAAAVALILRHIPFKSLGQAFIA